MGKFDAAALEIAGKARDKLPQKAWLACPSHELDRWTERVRDDAKKALTAAHAQGAEEEREACAEIVDEYGGDEYHWAVSDRIRARGGDRD
jgi:hypothetical protein